MSWYCSHMDRGTEDRGSRVCQNMESEQGRTAGEREATDEQEAAMLRNLFASFTWLQAELLHRGFGSGYGSPSIFQVALSDAGFALTARRSVRAQVAFGGRFRATGTTVGFLNGGNLHVLGWVREDTMASAFDDRRLWRLLAALTGMRLAMINAFSLFFERIPSRSVIEMRCAR